MRQLAENDVQGWLKLGVFLLIQTSIAVAFIVRIGLDADYAKSAALKADAEMQESKTDRALLRQQLLYLTTRLEEHMKGEKR